MSLAPTPGALDRAPLVRDMFDRIAPRYDLANRVMSLGLDQGWRRDAVRALADSGKGDVMGLCAGTLDLTLQLLANGARSVQAVDFSPQMLKSGAPKVPAGAPVTLTVADARELPFPDASFDAILCGFGLRNVPELPRAIAECARVLRPGGRLVILELCKPETLFSRVVQGSYNRLVVPVVGGLITGFGDAYRYLAGSIDAFTTRTELVALLEQCGLEATGRDVFPPVASIVVGRKGAAP